MVTGKPVGYIGTPSQLAHICGMVAVLQLPIISCLFPTYSSLLLTFIVTRAWVAMSLHHGDVGHFRWEYLEYSLDFHVLQFWMLSICVSYPALYVLICIPLDDSHQYLITLGWCWQFIENLRIKIRCKDTVCVLCIIHMVIMHKGLTCSYTGMVMTI